MAFEVLAMHVAVSVTSLMHWWTVRRRPYSAQEIARMLHEMNRATLLMALRQ